MNYHVKKANGKIEIDERWNFAKVDNGCLILSQSIETINIYATSDKISSGPISIYAPGTWKECHWK